MNALVTGGAGFVGRHVTDFLVTKGYKVTIFDNFSNSNFVASFADKDVKIVKGDITDFQKISEAVKDQDVVIHLAAKISVEESIKDPSETFRINVEGTKNVLDACKNHQVKKLIVASSAAVYGDSPPGVKLNESSKINPISPYGESKAAMEQEIKKFMSEHNIDCVILRFFNIFGPGQSSEYAGVITKFINRIAENKPLQIYGDGMQTRDFVAVQDVVDSVHNAILYGKNGTYNIASGKSITINELAEFMISLSGKNLKIEHVAPKKGDIRHSQADITLAKKELRYSPKLGLDEIKNLL
ncbi:MAG: NAD-dependent epimerase/dehydratase family protein [Thermoproteota archaeon]